MTDIAKTIYGAFAKYGKDLGVTSMTLTKQTTGARATGAIAGGTNPTSKSYKASGIVTDYTTSLLVNTLIKSGDRKVLIFGASLPDGVAPEPGDLILAVTKKGTERLFIVRDGTGVASDPVAATYTCQCRK